MDTFISSESYMNVFRFCGAVCGQKDGIKFDDALLSVRLTDAKGYPLNEDLMDDNIIRKENDLISKSRRGKSFGVTNEPFDPKEWKVTFEFYIKNKSSNPPGTGFDDGLGEKVVSDIREGSEHVLSTSVCVSSYSDMYVADSRENSDYGKEAMFYGNNMLLSNIQCCIGVNFKEGMTPRSFFSLLTGIWSVTQRYAYCKKDWKTDLRINVNMYDSEGKLLFLSSQGKGFDIIGVLSTSARNVYVGTSNFNRERFKMFPRLYEMCRYLFRDSDEAIEKFNRAVKRYERNVS